MKYYSLFEFSKHVKRQLAAHVSGVYQIVAEVAQIHAHASGHCYMELVEKDGQTIRAKCRAVIWAYTFRTLAPHFATVTGAPIKQGMKILLAASFDYHEVYGMSLNIKDIDPSFTLGERERKKQATIRRLQTEGVMGVNAALPLPVVVQRVAIISSASAAGYEDFIHQFECNPYGYRARFKLYSAVMQGQEAPASIIKSLHDVYDDLKCYDAVLLIRGGGSSLDLDGFDDYRLCNHLAQFPLPVITGIGHEKDWSVADQVAHTRLKTPTSVADFLVKRMHDFELSMHAASQAVTTWTKGMLQSRAHALLETKHSVSLLARQTVQQAGFELEKMLMAINTTPKKMIHQHQQRMQAMKRLVTAYDPDHTLKKGYTLTKVNGEFLRSNQKVKSGERLETISARHTIHSTVD